MGYSHTTRDVSLVFIELGVVILGLAVLARPSKMADKKPNTLVACPVQSPPRLGSCAVLLAGFGLLLQNTHTQKTSGLLCARSRITSESASKMTGRF